MKTDKAFEQYVSFETAYLLKKKGFNLGCVTSYHPYSRKFEGIWSDNGLKNSYIAAPTQQVAIRWLREKRNIHVYAELDCTKPGYKYRILMPLFNSEESNAMFDSYEFALEQGLIYALRNLLPDIDKTEMN